MISAGRDVTITTGPGGTKAPELRRKWHWASPLTQSLLAWIGLLSSLTSLLPLSQWLRSARASLAHADSGAAPGAEDSIRWVIIFFALVAVAALSFAGRNVTRHQKLLVMAGGLPCLVGWGGRLGLARVEAMCPLCEERGIASRLRIYRKPSRRQVNADGSYGKVLERTAVAECPRDTAHHCWLVSSA